MSFPRNADNSNDVTKPIAPLITKSSLLINNKASNIRVNQANLENYSDFDEVREFKNLFELFKCENEVLNQELTYYTELIEGLKKCFLEDHGRKKLEDSALDENCHPDIRAACIELINKWDSIATESTTLDDKGDEDLIYKATVKLLQFEGGTWINKGVGLVKLLRNKASLKCRLVMGTRFVLLNVAVIPTMKFNIYQQKNIQFYGVNMKGKGPFDAGMFSLDFFGTNGLIDTDRMFRHLQSILSSDEIILETSAEESSIDTLESVSMLPNEMISKLESSEVSSIQNDGSIFKFIY